MSSESQLTFELAIIGDLNRRNTYTGRFFFFAGIS